MNTTNSINTKNSAKKAPKIQLPGIGMRIVKSALAVAVCYLINLLRDDQGMVFYSQLAALWCIQMYRSNTKEFALQRTTGTIIGALYGLLYLIFIPSLISVTNLPEVIGKLIISVMIIAILYTTVLLKKKQASYFSCVVFLSIVVNHSGDLNPYMFVLNRFLDTMIGILVGVLINDVRLCFHPRKNTLFISGLDDMLLDNKEMLNAFSKVELNRMIESGMKFTISTMRTPAAIIEPMKDINLSLPVIAMNGAVLYNIRQNSYIKVYVISIETSQRLKHIIDESGLCCYSNVIIDDMLIIYYQPTEDSVNNSLVAKLRVSPYRNYVMRPLPPDESVVYFMLLDITEKINAFYEKLKNEGFCDQLRIITYASNDYPGYSYIKIYNKNATKENMINYLREATALNDVVTFGTIQGQYDVCLDTNDANKVVREVRKRYEPLFK